MIAHSTLKVNHFEYKEKLREALVPLEVFTEEDWDPRRD